MNLENKIKEFVKKNKEIFWDVNPENLSIEAILARVIDYGDLKHLRQLYKILGEEKFKQAFLNNLLDKDGKIKKRINIRDYKMIYILSHRLNLNDKIPLGDIISRAKKLATFNKKIEK